MKHSLIIFIINNIFPLSDSLNYHRLKKVKNTSLKTLIMSECSPLHYPNTLLTDYIILPHSIHILPPQLLVAIRHIHLHCLSLRYWRLCPAMRYRSPYDPDRKRSREEYDYAVTENKRREEKRREEKMC